MDKKIKDYIAENKLTDEDIYKLLTAETQSADEEIEETDVEEDSDVEQEADAEEDAAEEQPDIRVIIAEEIALALKSIKSGKKPAPKKKSKKKIVKKDLYSDVVSFNPF